MSPLKYRWWGDESKAVEWLSDAKRLLWKLKHRMRLGKHPLKQGSDFRAYKDGTEIAVRSVFGLDIIDITTLGKAVVSEKAGGWRKVFCVFLVYSQGYDQSCICAFRITLSDSSSRFEIADSTQIFSAANLTFVSENWDAAFTTVQSTPIYDKHLVSLQGTSQLIGFSAYRYALKISLRNFTPGSQWYYKPTNFLKNPTYTATCANLFYSFGSAGLDTWQTISSARCQHSMVNNSMIGYNTSIWVYVTGCPINPESDYTSFKRYYTEYVDYLGNAVEGAEIGIGILHEFWQGGLRQHIDLDYTIIGATGIYKALYIKDYRVDFLANKYKQIICAGNSSDEDEIFTHEGSYWGLTILDYDASDDGKNLCFFFIHQPNAGAVAPIIMTWYLYYKFNGGVGNIIEICTTTDTFLGGITWHSVGTFLSSQNLKINKDCMTYTYTARYADYTGAAAGGTSKLLTHASTYVKRQIGIATPESNIRTLDITTENWPTIRGSMYPSYDITHVRNGIGVHYGVVP